MEALNIVLVSRFTAHFMTLEPVKFSEPINHND